MHLFDKIKDKQVTKNRRLNKCTFVQLQSEVEAVDFRWIPTTGGKPPKESLFNWSLFVHHLAGIWSKQSITAAWVEANYQSFRGHVWSLNSKHSSKKQPTASLEVKTHQQFNALKVIQYLHINRFHSIIYAHWCFYKKKEVMDGLIKNHEYLLYILSVSSCVTVNVTAERRRENSLTDWLTSHTNHSLT